MAFRVEISAQAERDADAILEWLLLQYTGQAGIDWFLALDDAFASLAEFLERCPIAPENARFNFEVRQLLYGRKLIFIAYCSPSKPTPYMSCICGTVDNNLWRQPNKMERRQVRIQLQTKSVLSRSFLSCR